jgi:hypothetical protein
MSTPSEGQQPREDAPQPPAAMPSAQKPAQPSRRGRIAGAAALSVIVIVFATLFYTLSHKGPSTATPAPTAPINWQRYTDPGGYFSVSLPNGWTVERDTSGTAVMGNDSGSFTTQDIMDTLGGPPRGQNSITVEVLIEPLPNDFARQWMCGAFPASQNNTTIAGVPANVLDNTWLLNTNAAHFQISYVYPNWPGNVAMPVNAPTATPMPPGFYDRGQQEIQTIIASFLPIPDMPLACK